MLLSKQFNWAGRTGVGKKVSGVRDVRQKAGDQSTTLPADKKVRKKERKEKIEKTTDKREREEKIGNRKEKRG